MSKTQGTLVKELRSRLNEPNPTGFFADEELRAWLNEGAREAARRTEALRAKTTIAVLASTQDYTAPTDMVRIHRLEFQPTGSSQRVPLVYRDRTAMDVVWGTYQAISQSWWPEMYTTWGFPPAVTVTLYPTPTTAGTLHCYYYRLPASLTTTGTQATTTIDIPEGWEDAILSYAEARARLKQQRADLYQIAFQNFVSIMTALVETSARYTDAVGLVTPDFGWMGDEYGGAGD